MDVGLPSPSRPDEPSTPPTSSPAPPPPPPPSPPPAPTPVVATVDASRVTPVRVVVLALPGPPTPTGE